jgi:hypothetical protein
MSVVVWLLVVAAVLAAGVAVAALVTDAAPRALRYAEWNPLMWLLYAAAFASWALAASDAVSSGVGVALIVAGVAMLAGAEMVGRRARAQR